MATWECFSHQNNGECNNLLNGVYKMSLVDNNINITNTNKNITVWKTPNIEKYKLNIQNDGNLIISDNLGRLIWQTGPSLLGVPPFKLKLEETGNLNVYDAEYKTIWSTNLRLVDVVKHNIDSDDSHIIGKLQTLILNYGDVDPNFGLTQSMVIAQELTNYRKQQAVQASNVWCPLIWMSLALSGYNIPVHFYNNIVNVLKEGHMPIFEGLCKRLSSIKGWPEYAAHCLLNFNIKKPTHDSLPADILDYKKDQYGIRDSFQKDSKTFKKDYGKKYLKYKLKYLRLKKLF